MLWIRLFRLLHLPHSQKTQGNKIHSRLKSVARFPVHHVSSLGPGHQFSEEIASGLFVNRRFRTMQCYRLLAKTLLASTAQVRAALPLSMAWAHQTPVVLTGLHRSKLNQPLPSKTQYPGLVALLFIMTQYGDCSIYQELSKLRSIRDSLK